MKEAVKTIRSYKHTVDGLVNNAGISARESIYEYSPEEFDKIIGIKKLKAIHLNDSIVTGTKSGAYYST